MRKRYFYPSVLITALLLVTLSGCTAQNSRIQKEITARQDEMPQLLSWSEQIAVREDWLEKRHRLILDMMRRHEIGMWIIVNEEFHDDPLTQLIAPPLPYCGGRDIFIFIDGGENGLKKFAVQGFWEEHVRRFFETGWPDDPLPATEMLPKLIAEYQPKTIGLGMGGRRGVQRSLTHDTYLYLSKAVGPEAAKRFVSAAGLIEEYLDTRIPEELEHYRTLVRLTDVLTRRALSNEVITPGKTTVGELRRWMYDQVMANGCSLWFEPDIRLYKKGVKPILSHGFPSVAEENEIIHRGHMIHIDYGLIYMGFHSDWQKNAYVLLPGELDVPEGLKHAMANTNLLQDSLIQASRPGLTAGEVTQKIMDEMQEKSITAYIYSHPIGNQGHGLGTGLGYGFRPGSKGDPSRMPKRLRNGSYISVELNTVNTIPEWDNQKVILAMEDDAYLTEEGYKFFCPRQETFYLID